VALKKDIYKKLPRIYPKGEKRPPEADEIEPEKYKGCPNWQWWLNVSTQNRHKRPCRSCWGCRNHKHERVVGQAIAEAATSGIILGLTLTYRNNEDGSMPDSAKRLDYDDIRRFMARLRKKYQCSKISAGEYGGADGRAHWHLVVFFDLPPEEKKTVLAHIAANGECGPIEMSNGVYDNAPPYVANLRGKAFQEAIADPKTLVVSYPQRGKTPKIRNSAWQYWPHGIVECQVIKAPEYQRAESLEGAMRYPLKYLNKDAWKDSRKYKDIPFDDLPEHIKQQTNFGPWYSKEEIEERYAADVATGSVKTVYKGQQRLGQEHRKWRYGNKYRTQIEERLLRLPESEITIEQRPYKGLYNYKVVGGLGKEYFEALGAYTVSRPKEDAKLRTFKIGANFMKKQGRMQTLIDRGDAPENMKKRFSYIMSNTAYQSFWRGYNAELIERGIEPTAGPEDVISRLETNAAKALDSASGSFGYHMLRKGSKSQRVELEKRMGLVPDESLKGLFPTRWRRLMEETQPDLNWRIKGISRQRAEIEAQLKTHGAPMPELMRETKRNVDGAANLFYDRERWQHDEARKKAWQEIWQTRLLMRKVTEAAVRPELYEPETVFTHTGIEYELGRLRSTGPPR